MDNICLQQRCMLTKPIELLLMTVHMISDTMELKENWSVIICSAFISGWNFMWMRFVHLKSFDESLIHHSTLADHILEENILKMVAIFVKPQSVKTVSLDYAVAFHGSHASIAKDLHALGLGYQGNEQISTADGRNSTRDSHGILKKIADVLQEIF